MNPSGRGGKKMGVWQVVNPRWEEVGLTEEEYKRIMEILGREPNDLELGMYGLMWSEHCSYKHSKLHLRLFPTEGECVLQGPGENAGVVDIGDGMAVAFRLESHNHPSAIEPYQGAATGIGGIVRDILTMGARPIALLDSLRFGKLDDERTRYLFGGVVSGISGYGNCLGLPTVGGEVYFDDCYRGNPLVNVMCIGLMEKGRIVKGRASGVGNAVMVVGAKTGRDGIHGASLLASREFDEKSEEMRPAVQVGDPFMEKLLVESCLELVETDWVVGVNDLGAAGLTSACSETAGRAGSGMEVDVALVPRREEGMTPYEVMLSESQERMLVIIKKGKEKEVEKTFSKWGLDSAVIGRVTGDGMLTILENGRQVASVPAASLSHQAPVYNRERRRPAYLDQITRLSVEDLPVPREAGEVLRRLLASPNLGSREWIWRQYDYMVRTNTVVYPGADAAVLRVKGTGKGLAVTTDGNSRYCYLDPRTGGAIAVAEAARNVVCTGAKPLAITNCLNFGNPERPEVLWQFREVIEGMSTAARALGTPVTGGNVSFYNETFGTAIYPTPVVGMLGLLKDISRRVTPGFKEVGDVIILLGETREELGGTEYLKVVHGIVGGRPPEMDLNLEVRVQKVCLEAMERGWVKSAHDVSDGGLAVALAECCFWAEPGAAGCEVTLETGIRPDAVLFGESQSRVILTVKEDDLSSLLAMARSMEVAAGVLGRVVDGRLSVGLVTTGGTGKKSTRRVLMDEPTQELYKIWRNALPEKMK